MNFPSERPDWLVEAGKSMRGLRYFPETKQISVTTLLKPAHMLRLQHRHQDQIETDPMDLIPALVGVAWHAYVERYALHGVCERPQNATLAGWTITGIPDWYDPAEGVLRDHKTTRMWSKVFGRREWEEQLNCYRWLLAMNGITINRMEIHAVYLDWSAKQVARNFDLPRERAEVIEVAVWPMDDTQRFLRERLARLIEWDMDKQAPICSPDERWERGEHWAVMKTGRKRALKRCTSQLEAQSYVDQESGLFVEHRPGEPVRCQSYCPVREFCSFGRNIGADQETRDL